MSDPNCIHIAKSLEKPTARPKFVKILVDKIISKKELGEDTTAEEQKIDIMVYKFYELTYDEVKIVEPEISITNYEYDNYE